MPSERFSWSEPKLCSYNYNVAEKWFVYFDYTDHLTGEVKRLQFRGPINRIKSKEDRLLHGNALITYWKQELRAGWNPFGNPEDLPITRPTITQAINTIFELKKITCSTKGLEKYRYQIKLFTEWLDANKYTNILLCRFQTSIAQQYVDFLILKKQYAGRTFNDHITTLKTFFFEFVDREWIDKNPFAKVKKRPVTIGRNIAFTASEKTILTEYLIKNDKPLFYFTQFVYYSFIRRSELTRLKIENIDFVNWTIITHSSKSKNRKQESVVISSQLKEFIITMGLQQMPLDWFIFGRGLVPGPIPIINYNHISTRHNTICKNLGFNSEKGLYSWKHSGVCYLYPKLNGDIYALMRQLRHSELNTTQIYLKSLGLADNLAVRNAEW